MMVFIKNGKNYMFRPIAAIIRFLKLSCLKYNMHKPRADIIYYI